MYLFQAALIAVVLMTPGIGSAVPGAGALEERCFPETRKCISGLFYNYWVEHGGLAQQGYPITEAFYEASTVDGTVYRVQYFERARFEHHPENAGTPFEVLLGQLGYEQFLAKYPEGRDRQASTPGGSAPAGAEVCFNATGRCMRGLFYEYWQRNGGLAQQGYPISDEFEEVSPTDGRSYRVQYFERARFEHHPEHAGTRFEVLLGLLGREQLRGRYPNDTPIFRDDLTKPGSGWMQGEVPDYGAISYVDGGYRILINQRTRSLFATHPILKDLPDVRVEVDAVKLGGPNSNGFGVVCRAKDQYHFYVLRLASNGFYVIEKVDGYRRIELGSGSSGAIRPNAPNHVRADCVGNTLTLHANGRQLLQVRDAEYASGIVGLYVGSNDIAGVDIRFNNFVVVKP